MAAKKHEAETLPEAVLLESTLPEDWHERVLEALEQIVVALKKLAG